MPPILSKTYGAAGEKYGDATNHGTYAALGGIGDTATGTDVSKVIHRGTDSSVSIDFVIVEKRIIQETGSGTDFTIELDVEIDTTDSGTAADNGSLGTPINASDSAHGTDIITTRKLVLTESPHGTDRSWFPKFATPDTAHGTDTSSPHASMSVFDHAGGTFFSTGGIGAPYFGGIYFGQIGNGSIGALLEPDVSFLHARYPQPDTGFAHDVSILTAPVVPPPPIITNIKVLSGTVRFRMGEGVLV